MNFVSTKIIDSYIKNINLDDVPDNNKYNVEVPTKDNICNYLNFYSYNEEEIRRIFNELLNILDDPNEKKYAAKIILIFAYNNIKFLSENKLYALLIKYSAHHFIVEKGWHDLVYYYNLIFNDKMYNDVADTNIFEPVLSSEWINEKIKIYQNKCRELEIKKRLKDKSYKYEKGEIVGAKDKEGRWWMSRIIEIFNYNQHYIYYVEFLGWGEKFNEFITDRFRIARYNPLKHKYFRPGWNKNKIEAETAEPAETVEPAETAESAETAEPAETAESVEPNDLQDTAEHIEQVKYNKLDKTIKQVKYNKLDKHVNLTTKEKLKNVYNIIEQFDEVDNSMVDNSMVDNNLDLISPSADTKISMY